MESICLRLPLYRPPCLSLFSFPPYTLFLIYWWSLYRRNAVVSFCPWLGLPLVGPGQIFSSCQFVYFSGLFYSYWFGLFSWYQEINPQPKADCSLPWLFGWLCSPILFAYWGEKAEIPFPIASCSWLPCYWYKDTFLSGKCISFSLAIPGTRLFLNEVYNVIGKGRRYGSSKLITISGQFREELQQWLFLESWSGCLPWHQEAHCQVKLCTDASSFAWGCVFGPDTIAAVIRDFWPVDQHHLHINVKEALALANALDSFSSSFCDSWVDVYTDSQVLIASWRRQGSKPRDLADVFKRIFGIVSTYNIHLNLFYISSADNPADTPSRVFPLQDSKLSPSAWVQVQAEFGGRSGHSADLMALPFYLQCALDGSPLPFFSPYSLPGSSGVNLFAQRPDNHGCLFSNPYVFPPIILIPQVLGFVKTHCFACTIVIPDVRPREFWGPQGSQGIVLFTPYLARKIFLTPHP